MGHVDTRFCHCSRRQEAGAIKDEIFRNCSPGVIVAFPGLDQTTEL
jgi:hypothetical protein